MSNRFTYHGTVHELGDVKTFNSGFKKRDLICKTVGEKFTDYAVFTAKKETCDRIATLKPGDKVAVDFALDGHEWNGQNGKRWFGGATALKVDMTNGVNAGSLNDNKRPDATAPSVATPVDTVAYDAVADDMPF